MNRLLLVTVCVLVARVAHAESGITLANQLGSVLAAERPCHLTYDQQAIQRYIAANVPASDMAFAGFLQMFVQSEAVEIGEMSPATVVAFCAQTARVARFNGFIH